MFDFASLSSLVVHLVLATLYLFVVPAVARHLANASYPSLPALASVHTQSSSEHGLTPSHSVARRIGHGDDNDGCGITIFAADVYGHSFNLIGLRTILDTSRLF
ncbi:hypothetical protein B0H14DRAFT_3484669 [Mycena olivaceomarginata]|nr:hypothetical protein B0H14DRAFT_3484669 [Mycena olivaceomarginata]